MKQKVLVFPYIVKSGKPQYFIAQRPESKIWQLVSGKVGDEIKNEKVIECAKRELGEELGVKNYLNFINTGKSFTFTRETDGRKFHEHVFAVELKDQKIKLEKAEFERFKFLPLAKAQEFLYWPSHKKFLGVVNKIIIRKKHPKIFIILGAGASGKETIIAEVLKRIKTVKRAATATTRRKQAGEKGRGRIFISEKEFNKMKRAGELIETNFFNGSWYGSIKKEVNKYLDTGKNVLMELDLNGLKAIRKKYSNVISIFIDVPLDELEKRLILRGRDSKKIIEGRMKIARWEEKNKGICDFVVKNKEGKLDLAVKRVINIIRGAG